MSSFFDETQELEYSVDFSETQNESDSEMAYNFDDTQELQYSVDLSQSQEAQEENKSSEETEELSGSEETEDEEEHLMDFSGHSSSSDSSEASDSEQTSDENEDILVPDYSSLKPYDHEPTRSLSSPSPSHQSQETANENINRNSRIGNTKWCSCGKCQAMETEEESLCCRDTNEIPDEKFSGKIFIICKNLMTR